MTNLQNLRVIRNRIQPIKHTEESSARIYYPLQNFQGIEIETMCRCCKKTTLLNFLCHDYECYECQQELNEH